MTRTAAALVALTGADPATYVPHAVHGPDRAYRETNCYTDVVVELLHARGDEPLAVLGHTVRLDFEGDQWTFFKPPPGDLERLLGIDVHEMQPYRPLPEQLAAQLALGRTMIVELDSFWLPDTAATAYRREHVKTSVAVEAIDREGERLRYFHNAGLYELQGEDYREIFRCDDPARLPPYVELVRFDAGERLAGAALRDAATAVFARHLALRPATNPFARFAAALEAELPVLQAGTPADVHAYVFATTRMVGSACGLLGAHATWLVGARAAPAVSALDRIVDGCKLLSLKLARRRPFDPGPLVGELAAAWEEAVAGLDAALA